jgi:hypothetical protein
MEETNLQRPRVPVPLNIELIRATFKPLSNRDYVVPLNECISEQLFERIEGEGFGDGGAIGIMNSIHLQQGKQRQAESELPFLQSGSPGVGVGVAEPVGKM